MIETVGIYPLRSQTGVRIYKTGSPPGMRRRGMRTRPGAVRARVRAAPEKTRVVLADDHSLIRKGIRKILERADDIQVIGEARDGKEALKLVQSLMPDVLVLDLEMPVLNGSQVADRIQELEIRVHILVLSAHDDRQYILSMFEKGVDGYLIKDEAPESVVKAVRKVAQGDQKWVSRQTAEKVGISLPANRNIPH